MIVKAAPCQTVMTTIPSHARSGSASSEALRASMPSACPIAGREKLNR